MLSLLFEIWLVLVGLALVMALLVAAVTGGSSGPGSVAYDNAKAARVRAKPQRVVFWWLPHDQGP